MRSCRVLWALVPSLLTVIGLAGVVPAQAAPRTPHAAPAAAVPAPASGYWLAGADAKVFGFGSAASQAPLGTALAAPIVGMASTPSGDGYWLVGSDGGVFAFGDARFLGSLGGNALAAPIVGMAATPSGDGYWLVGSDGGVFTFGDAVFHGSTGNVALNKPIVGMSASAAGYWLVASDGGIFTFGDAGFHGSTGNVALHKPVVGMTSTPSGNGYWLVASDGGIFTFGDAAFHGSTGDRALHGPIVGMAASAGGYWLVGSDGGIFSFGDAVFRGSAGNMTLAKPIVAMSKVAASQPPRVTGVVPSAPANVFVEDGFCSLTVTFAVPSSAGSSPVISYTATASPGPYKFTGEASPLLVGDGLSMHLDDVPDGIYHFTVHATNAAGDGPESAPSLMAGTSTNCPPPPAPTVTAVSPATGPRGGGTVVTVTGTGFTGVVGVSFGSPATAVSVINDSTLLATSPAGSGTVDVIVPGLGGRSAIGANDKFTYLPDPLVPAAPTGVSAVIECASAAVFFTAPVGNGTQPIIEYTAVADGGQMGTGVSSPITVRGLSQIVPSSFTVYATNSAGNGPPSVASAPVSSSCTG